jgi:hypothetical protein
LKAEKLSGFIINRAAPYYEFNVADTLEFTMAATIFALTPT